ncbi:MAG: hypothetical protein OHK0039_25530 [Bacteroidia bacterium]
MSKYREKYRQMMGGWVLLLIVLPTMLPVGLAAQSAAYYQMSARQFFALPQLDAPLDPQQVDYALLDAAIFWYTNRERVRNNRPVARYDAAIHRVATYHARAMARYEFMAHINPHEPAYATLAKRSRRLGGQAVAENVASHFIHRYAPSSPYVPRRQQDGTYAYFTTSGRQIVLHSYRSFAESLVQAWMASPGHRANILNPGLRKLACAVRLPAAPLGSEEIPLAYSVQNFGR